MDADIDVMVESKAKELSILLYRLIELHMRSQPACVHIHVSVMQQPFSHIFMTRSTCRDIVKNGNAGRCDAALHSSMYLVLKPSQTTSLSADM
jgi:hypothetical protein